jgi:hypothetical protein
MYLFMKLIKCVLFIVLSFCCNTADAQALFVRDTFNTKVNERSIAVLEPSPGSYLFMGLRQNDSNACFFFCTDAYGNVTQTRYLFGGTPHRRTEFLNMHMVNDSTIALVGLEYKTPDNIVSVAYGLIDTHWNVLSYKTYPLEGENTSVSMYNTVHNNRFYTAVAGNYVNPMGSTLVRLFKATMEGDTLNTRMMDSSYFHRNYYAVTTSGIAAAANGNELMVPEGLGTFIHRVDTTLNWTDTLRILSVRRGTGTIGTDTVLAAQASVFETSPGTILAGPRFVSSAIGGSARAWGLVKYNAREKRFIGTHVFGEPAEDADHYYQRATGKTMLLDKGMVYAAGTLTVNGKYMVVSACDSNTNARWVKYFGGSMACRVNELFMCADGQLMVLGTKYRTGAVADTSGDFYIFKLNPATGTPTAITNVTAQMRSGISIYPNPANDELHLKVTDNTNAGPGTISICDMQGRTMLRYAARIDNNTMISIRDLAPGTYVLSLSDAKHGLFTNQVFVKQ